MVSNIGFCLWNVIRSVNRWLLYCKQKLHCGTKICEFFIVAYKVKLSLIRVQFSCHGDFEKNFCRNMEIEFLEINWIYSITSDYQTNGNLFNSTMCGSNFAPRIFGDLFWLFEAMPESYTHRVHINTHTQYGTYHSIRKPSVAQWRLQIEYKIKLELEMRTRGKNNSLEKLRTKNSKTVDCYVSYDKIRNIRLISCVNGESLPRYSSKLGWENYYSI